MKLAIVIAFASALGGCATSASAQVATDSRGEQVIVANAVQTSIHRTDSVRWLCVDPVEVTIVYTLRENGEMLAASISTRIANIAVEKDISDEILDLANKPMFKIYGLCIGDRPIALVNYAEDLIENLDETTSAKIVSTRISLRDPAPPSD